MGGAGADLLVATVRSVVLRLSHCDDIEASILVSLDKYLSALPKLDSFIFETEVNSWHHLIGTLPPLLRARLQILGNTSIVWETTCTEAHRRAARRRLGNAHGASCDADLPISPLWWMATHASLRPELKK